MPRQRERRRHLAGYRECVAEWLRGSSNGKAGGGRMYFTGPTLYSYGRHYPMAHIVGNYSGCLVNSDSDSVTTNKHMSIVRSMVSSVFSDDIVFYLPTNVIKALLDNMGSLTAHAMAFDYWRGIAKEAFERSVNKRVREWNRSAAGEEAMRALETANRYAAFYGLRQPFNINAAPEAIRFAWALGDDSSMVAYLVKEPQ